MIFSKKIFAAAGIIIFLVSCSLSQKTEREIMSEIYSDSLAYEFSLGSRGNINYCKDGDLVISSLTDDYSFDEDSWQWASNNFPQLERETWETFLQVSSQQIPFPTDLDLGCQYTLLDVKQNPPDWSWENCVGVEYFSQIGFNSRKNQALVFRASSCGDFAYGNLYFAEVVDGHWKVTDMAEVFIT
jgi:hypothetical protein